MPLSALPATLNAWCSAFAAHEVVFPEGNCYQIATKQKYSAYVVLMGRDLSLAEIVQTEQKCLELGMTPSFFQPFQHQDIWILLVGLSGYSAELQAWIKQQSWPIDAAHLESLPDLRQPGLILMDMDSTAIQIECIDEIARLAGVGEQVSAVTAAAMHGHLEFSESLRNRVALLKGVPQSTLDQVASHIPLMPGLTELVSMAKQANWRVAIASGGFTYFAGVLQRDLGLDHIEANVLAMEDGVLTGKVDGRIIDSKVKRETLHLLRERYQLQESQTVAIGDGANDLPMLGDAALGVAIHAKPIVREQAQVAINHMNLEAVQCLLLSGTRIVRS